MFIELCNPQSGLQHIVSIDSIESCEFESTTSKIGSPMFGIRLRLNNGKEHLLTQTTNEDKINKEWETLRKALGCKETITFA